MKLETEIECPNCKRQIKVKLEEMVPGKSKSCNWCKTEIKFTGDNGNEIQKSFDDFQKSLKKLFK